MCMLFIIYREDLLFKYKELSYHGTAVCYLITAISNISHPIIPGFIDCSSVSRTVIERIC